MTPVKGRRSQNRLSLPVGWRPWRLLTLRPVRFRCYVHATSSSLCITDPGPAHHPGDNHMRQRWTQKGGMGGSGEVDQDKHPAYPSYARLARVFKAGRQYTRLTRMAIGLASQAQGRRLRHKQTAKVRGISFTSSSHTKQPFKRRFRAAACGRDAFHCSHRVRTDG